MTFQNTKKRRRIQKKIAPGASLSLLPEATLVKIFSTLESLER
jgi:hypothetical protein